MIYVWSIHTIDIDIIKFTWHAYICPLTSKAGKEIQRVFSPPCSIYSHLSCRFIACLHGPKAVATPHKTPRTIVGHSAGDIARIDMDKILVTFLNSDLGIWWGYDLIPAVYPCTFRPLAIGDTLEEEQWPASFCSLSQARNTCNL